MWGNDARAMDTEKDGEGSERDYSDADDNSSMDGGDGDTPGNPSGDAVAARGALLRDITAALYKTQLYGPGGEFVVEDKARDKDSYRRELMTAVGAKISDAEVVEKIRAGVTALKHTKYTMSFISTWREIVKVLGDSFHLIVVNLSPEQDDDAIHTPFTETRGPPDAILVLAKPPASEDDDDDDDDDEEDWAHAYARGGQIFLLATEPDFEDAWLALKPFATKSKKRSATAAPRAARPSAAVVPRSPGQGPRIVSGTTFWVLTRALKDTLGSTTLVDETASGRMRLWELAAFAQRYLNAVGAASDRLDLDTADERTAYNAPANRYEFALAVMMRDLPPYAASAIYGASPENAMAELPRHYAQWLASLGANLRANLTNTRFAAYEAAVVGLARGVGASILREPANLPVIIPDEDEEESVAPPPAKKVRRDRDLSPDVLDALLGDADGDDDDPDPMDIAAPDPGVTSKRRKRTPTVSVHAIKDFHTARRLALEKAVALASALRAEKLTDYSQRILADMDSEFDDIDEGVDDEVGPASLFLSTAYDRLDGDTRAGGAVTTRSSFYKNERFWQLLHAALHQHRVADGRVEIAPRKAMFGKNDIPEKDSFIGPDTPFEVFLVTRLARAYRLERAVKPEVGFTTNDPAYRLFDLNRIIHGVAEEYKSDRAANEAWAQGILDAYNKVRATTGIAAEARDVPVLTAQFVTSQYPTSVARDLAVAPAPLLGRVIAKIAGGAPPEPPAKDAPSRPPPVATSPGGVAGRVEGASPATAPATASATAFAELEKRLASCLRDKERLEAQVESLQRERAVVNIESSGDSSSSDGSGGGGGGALALAPEESEQDAPASQPPASLAPEESEQGAPVSQPPKRPGPMGPVDWTGWRHAFYNPEDDDLPVDPGRLRFLNFREYKEPAAAEKGPGLDSRTHVVPESIMRFPHPSELALAGPVRTTVEVSAFAPSDSGARLKLMILLEPTPGYNPDDPGELQSVRPQALLPLDQIPLAKAYVHLTGGSPFAPNEMFGRPNEGMGRANNLAYVAGVKFNATAEAMGKLRVIRYAPNLPRVGPAGVVVMMQNPAWRKKHVDPYFPEFRGDSLEDLNAHNLDIPAPFLGIVFVPDNSVYLFPPRRYIQAQGLEDKPATLATYLEMTTPYMLNTDIARPNGAWPLPSKVLYAVAETINIREGTRFYSYHFSPNSANTARAVLDPTPGGHPWGFRTREDGRMAATRASTYEFTTRADIALDVRTFFVDYSNSDVARTIGAIIEDYRFMKSPTAAKYAAFCLRPAVTGHRIDPDDYVLYVMGDEFGAPFRGNLRLTYSRIAIFELDEE